MLLRVLVLFGTRSTGWYYGGSSEIYVDLTSQPQILPY